MASRGPPGARAGSNNRFAQFKLVLLGMFDGNVFKASDKANRSGV